MNADATPPPFLPQETLRRLREATPPAPGELAAFVAGIASGQVSDAQVGAFAMAVRCRGLGRADTVALTRAMRDSGDRLDWRSAALGGPVVDKHSTGGVGDLVSLLLGPLLAACGGFVPMVSGRGLGHTGGTLDKLEALPGYNVHPDRAQLLRVLRQAGVAIVGAGPALAPADQRLYAVRDVTATVDSLPLITASILSKKLAAGLDALVLDVKHGNGAFMPALDDARALARSLVSVACEAGLPTEALLTDMNQPLAPCAGNALETALSIELLRGVGLDDAANARLVDVTLALGATLLRQCGLAASESEGRDRLMARWRSGHAAERFAQMVHGLGGPGDVLTHPAQHLGAAPVLRPVPPADADRDRPFVAQVDTRALGLAVVALGGGRLRNGDRIDPRVGLSGLAPLGPRAPGAPLAWVHAADEAQAQVAIAQVRAAHRLSDQAPPPAPAVLEHLTHQDAL